VSGPTQMQLAGIHEAAEVYGFTKQAVFNRLHRGTMPKPIAQLQMGPVWLLSDLIAHKRHLDLVAQADAALPQVKEQGR
jgi:hypothetical protein